MAFKIPNTIREMKKRILFVNQVSYVGGSSYCMLALIKAIDRCKFEPVVLLRKEGSLASELRSDGIEVHFFPQMTTIPYNKSLYNHGVISSYWRIIRSQNSFKELLLSINADIVYLNNMMLYPYLKSAKECGCKTIMHVREHWPKQEHRMQMMMARKTAKKYADKMVAINHYSASMFPECASKMSIIYDWIDFSDRYEPRPFDEIFGANSSKLKVFLFTGGLGHIKGTYDVVSSFSKVVKGDDFRLLLMGTGLDYKLNLVGWKGLIEKLLMLTGWKPYGYKTMEAIKKDRRIVCVPASYKIVDIFRQSYCMLSYFNIPHANLAMAEAIVLGLPVIAAQTEESIEYSDNGNGAILFEFHNKKDFERKIEYVISNDSFVKEGVNNSSDNVKQMFDSMTNAAKLNDVCSAVAF